MRKQDAGAEHGTGEKHSLAGAGAAGCGSGPISTTPGSCGDIEFYLVEVKFDALDDAAESSFLKRLPTSFVLKPEEVDQLRDAARRILTQSTEFQRLVRDLQ